MNDKERRIYTFYRERNYDANTALKIARAAAKRPEIEWDEVWSYPLLAQATVERDGFEVRVRIMREEDTPRSITWTDDKPAVMPNLYANPNEWLDEPEEDWTGQACGRRRVGNYYGWVDPEDWMKWSEVSSPQRGESKQVAFERAVREVRKWVQWVTSDEYLEVFVVADAYKDGVELGSDSIGGIEIGSPYAPRDMLVEVEAVAIGDHDLIENAVAEAKEKLAELNGDPQGRSLTERFDNLAETLRALYEHVRDDEQTSADTLNTWDRMLDAFDELHNAIKETP